MNIISKRLQNFYTKVSENYDFTRYENHPSKKLYLNVANNSFLRNIPKDKDIRIMDFASGTGRLSLLLSEFGYKTIAVDISESMLRIAQKKIRNIKDNSIQCVIADGLNLPFDKNIFDCIIASKFFHTMEYKYHPKYLDELFSVLKPNGRIIADFNNIIFWWFLKIFKGKWRKGGRFYSPFQKRNLYKKWNIVKIDGQWMPFSYYVFRLSKKIYRCYDSLSKNFLVKYLCSKLVIIFEKK